MDLDKINERRAALIDRISAVGDIGLASIEIHVGIVEYAVANLDTPILMGVYHLGSGADMLERPDRVYNHIVSRSGGVLQLHAQIPTAYFFDVPSNGGDVMAKLIENEAARRNQATAGSTHVVSGATITERPDLAYAASIAAGPVTVHDPEPEHPADLAQFGGAWR